MNTATTGSINGYAANNRTGAWHWIPIWIVAAAVVAAGSTSTALPLHAQSLPPLLCIGDNGSAQAAPKPNVFVISAGKIPLQRTSLGGCLQPAAARWSTDHRSVLVAPSVQEPMFLCRYNPFTSTFGPRQDVAATLGSPGTRYQVHITDFDWSRDGTRLVMANRQRLVVLDLKTGRKRLVYHTPLPSLTVTSVAWSPNGKKIAFCLPNNHPSSSTGGGYYEEVWVIDADGSGLRRLGRGSGPSWSADSRRLIAVGLTSGGNPAITSYSSMGEKQRVLWQMRRTTEEDFFRSVAYSPDGHYIAVFGPQPPFSPSGGYKTSLYLINRAGQYVRPLVTQTQIPKLGYPSQLTW